MTRRAGCQKATMELSLQNLQLLSHLQYPMDTYQLTSSQGEADGVSEWEYDIAGVGRGEFALRLVPRQRAAPFYRRLRSHTHTHTHTLFYSTLLALTHRQNHRQRVKYTCYARAGGTFFPVVQLCQYLVLVGNRFWFYILHICTQSTIQLWCRVT